MIFKRVAENLYKCQPYGVYYAVWSAHGEKQRKSLKTKDRQVAAVELRKTLERLRGLDRNKRGVTFAQLADDWKAVVLAGRDLKPSALRDRLYNIKSLLKEWPHLQTMAVRDITATDCRRWFARRRPKVGAQLLNNELGCLKQVLTWAVAEGVIHENPATDLKRLKIPTPEIAVPSRAEFAAIVDYLHTHNGAEAGWFVELLAYSGLRLNEAASLAWADVDYGRHQFRVTGGEQGTKNRQHRWVPLFPSLDALLHRIPRMIGRETVLAARSCRGSLKKACVKLGFPVYSHHDFRHFFVSNAIEEGIDFKTIAGWVGHQDGGLLVARTYGHLRPIHSENMAARMTYSANHGQVDGVSGKVASAGKA